MKWDERGLLKGPTENEHEYEERIRYCLSLKKTIHTEFPELGEQTTDVDPEALALTRELFGIEPDWVPIFYSNSDLPPWHGGSAWIFQKNQETPRGALIQMRKNWFSKKSSLFGLYTKKEIQAHELVHASRMMFDEPKYEEILAYETSSSSLRKWIGPLVRSRREAMIFFLFILLLVILDAMILFSGYEELYPQVQWLKLLPLGLLALAFARVAAAKMTLKRFCKKMGKDGLKLALRMSDKEIDRVANT